MRLSIIIPVLCRTTFACTEPDPMLEELVPIELSESQIEFYTVYSYVVFIDSTTQSGQDLSLERLTRSHLMQLVQAVVSFHGEEFGEGKYKQRYADLCRENHTIETARDALDEMYADYQRQTVERFRQIVKDSTTPEGYREVMKHASLLMSGTRVHGGPEKGDGADALGTINNVCSSL